MFNYLIYMSESATLMQDEELTGLLNISRDWNETHGITGMLLYVHGKFLMRTGGRFIQVLEGPASDVEIIFEKIKSDKRHQNIIILNESTTEKRNFGAWSMGFKLISSEDDKNIPGFFELNHQSLNLALPKNFNIPLTYLKSFYQMNAAQ